MLTLTPKPEVRKVLKKVKNQSHELKHATSSTTTTTKIKVARVRAKDNKKIFGTADLKRIH